MKKLNFLLALIIFSILLQIGLPSLSLALSQEQKNLYNQNILYYDIDVAQCVADANEASLANTNPGQGAPNGLSFPNLDPGKMATAINKFIETERPNSQMKGLGNTIVAGAQNSNISPFFIVGIAEKESGIGDPGFGDGYNVRRANNSFGRTAIGSQPNIRGAGVNANKLWYKWNSIRASVDHTAPENINANGGGDAASYLREEFDTYINQNDIVELMYKYAPPNDGNNTEGYIRDLKQRIAAMVELTGASVATAEPVAETQAQICCGTVIRSSTPGRTPEEKIWNFLVDTIDGLGLTDIQAAGVMGNIEQESGFRTTALNPSSGAYGIIQWYAGRKTALQNYANEQNKQVSNLDLQLEFMKKELETDYKSRVLDPIKASTTMAEATRIWLERFEVPCLPGSSQCDTEMNIRLPNAENWFNAFGGGKASQEIGNNPDDCANTAVDTTVELTADGSGTTSGQFAWPDADRKDPVNSCYGQRWGRLHTGLDIASASGKTVTASDGGTVTSAGDNSDGFGKKVIIKHENGKWTLYAHNSSVSVRNGQKVDQGSIIAKVGNTGNSQGPHIHFNIQNAGGAAQSPIDPLPLLPKDGRQTSGTNCPGGPLR